MEMRCIEYRGLEKNQSAYDACFCRNRSEKIGHLAVMRYYQLRAMPE